MLITSLQIKESRLRKLRCWFQVTKLSIDLKKPNSELFSLCFDWLTSHYSVPGNAGHDWFVSLSIYSSINPCIYHLSINYPSTHSHMYLSIHLYLSIFPCTYHLSISCILYLCICHLVIHWSMYLSPISYPSIHSSSYPSIHPAMYILSIIYPTIIHPSLHLSVVFVSHRVINFLMLLTTCLCVWLVFTSLFL